MGSSLVFSWSMDQAGVIRLSDEALSDTTMSGTSAMVVMVGVVEVVKPAADWN